MFFVYMMITKDINTRAIEKCEKLETQVENQEKMINFLVGAGIKPSNDTVTIKSNK
jgi:copper homeostasis protein CutC